MGALRETKDHKQLFQIHNLDFTSLRTSILTLLPTINQSPLSSRLGSALSLIISLQSAF